MFKTQVVRELSKEELSVGQIGARSDVHPTQLYQWKAIAIKGLPNLFIDGNKARDTA